MYAIEDMWLVGDDFALSGIRTQHTISTEREREKCRPLYTYDKYNVHIALQSSFSNNDNILSRMLNGIIHSITGRNKIPRLIVLIFDYNFLKIAHMADPAVAWLYNQIVRAFEARKDQLPSKGIPNWSVPYVVAVKPITRPTWTAEYNQFKLSCREVMRAMQNQTMNLDTFYTLHIDSI